MTERLKVSKLLDVRTSNGIVFHILAADTENEFSFELVLNLGICNSALSTERVFLLCVSETFLNKSFT